MKPAFSLVATRAGMSEYVHHKNGLRVLHYERRGSGSITTNIVYKVGSVHESVGETGLAHMLEHMLFKPTASDRKARREARIMSLERNHGVLINASTWRDRTNYYCLSPVTYLDEILNIEAERLTSVVLTQDTLAPEQATVVSEFDMYFSQPAFALDREVSATAYLVHPYRHETIGWREDILNYTPQKLEKFYRQHYRTGNATLIVVGDVTIENLLSRVELYFGHLEDTGTQTALPTFFEPVQTGKRHVSFTRESTTQLLSINAKCPGFRDEIWSHWYIFLKLLADGPDSFLVRAFEDTGKVVSVGYNISPTREPFLANLTAVLPEPNHEIIEAEILAYIAAISKSELTASLKRTLAQVRYLEPFSRTSSQMIASELTEYIASDNWQTWHDVIKIVESITPQDIFTIREQFLKASNMTTGYFIGKK